MTTARTKLLTADDLARLVSQGVRGELIRGVLYETMPTGVNHARIVVKLVLLLGAFIAPRRLGTIMASDLGVVLERGPDTVREPDIAYISAERMPLGLDVPGYSELVPDLVVEVVSPNDRLSDVDEKARMWRDFGARLVWVVYPDTRSVDIYGEDGTTETLTENDILSGNNVLPGFACSVSEIFEA